MQEARKLVEYGVPIDPEVMVTPPEATELELEPGHPGLGDPFYIQRRKNLFALCRRHRLEELGPPLIDYTAEETRIWRDVSPKLNELHVKHACQIYLAAKRDLAINQQEIPQLRTLSERVRLETNMHLVPAGPPDVKLAFDSVGRLPQEVETALYRVAVEALTNAIHHAHASEVVVLLGTDGRQLTLRIEDDGTGIRPGPDGALPGFGLAAMFYASLWVMGRTGFFPESEYFWVAMNDLYLINLFWGLFNLIPVLPLDGGQVTARELSRFLS